MKELIRNRIHESDGVFRIDMSGYRNFDGDSVIEVHGFPPNITMIRKKDGVEIVWDVGTLESSPNIDSSWQDVTFDETVYKLFLRSSFSLPRSFSE